MTTKSLEIESIALLALSVVDIEKLLVGFNEIGFFIPLIVIIIYLLGSAVKPFGKAPINVIVYEFTDIIPY